jgi:chromosome segregation ATPase
MPPATTSNTTSIDDLRKRYEQLKEKRVVAETRLSQTKDTLDQLKKEAQEQWGTDNLAELEAKLAKQQAENERLRISYEASLQKIESDLKAIEGGTAK